jgi:phosphoribosylaminoimidazole-succinocarboxamide synthase
VGRVPLAASSFSGLTHLGSGKVREMFAVDGPDGEPAILLVASDRISAYDVILPTEIPDKGAVLTALSLWWFDQLADLVPSHLLTARVAEYPDALPSARHVPGRVRGPRLPHR